MAHDRQPTPPPGPHEVDQHVGARIRQRRREMRVSQEALAEMIGLTFQQVQKYERGINRVSASRLFGIARALETRVAYFYEELPDDDEAEVGPCPNHIEAFLLSDEGAELAEAMLRIPSSALRRKLADLIRALADQDARSGCDTHRES